MDRHNNTGSRVQPAALEWFLNISCCLWTSVFIALFVSQPAKVNWLVTVGKRFNWQVIMGCDRSNKEAQSRSRARADRTHWLMSDRFLKFYPAAAAQLCVDGQCGVWNYAGLSDSYFRSIWSFWSPFPQMFAHSYLFWTSSLVFWFWSAAKARM